MFHRRYKLISILYQKFQRDTFLSNIAMAGPRKTSPIVRTYLKQSRSGVQARIYSHQYNLDKTSVGRDLEQALKRLKQEIEKNPKGNRRK